MNSRRTISPEWSIDDDKELRRLIGQGFPWRRIAAEMSRLLSDCMRRGRVLGITTKRRVKKPVVKKPRIYDRKVVLPQPEANRSIYDRMTEDGAFCQPVSVALIDAGFRQCRWPINAGDQPHCCGRPATRISYCADHSTIAFRGASS